MMNVEIFDLILGGALTILGTLIGALILYFSQYKERSERKNDKLRDKYEELFDHLTITIEWIQKLYKCRSFEETKRAMPPASARKMIMIANFYFRDLLEPVNDYCSFLITYYNWTLGIIHKREGELGVLLMLSPDYKKMDEKYDTLKAKLEMAIISNIKKYIRL